MVEPKVGQRWVHRERDVELYVETLLPKNDGLRARWANTTGFLSMKSLQKNYAYASTPPKAVLDQFGWLYHRMVADMIEQLEAMDEADLITTLDATETLDPSCWWATWEAHAVVGDECRRLLYPRPKFERAGCGRVDPHVPHMWDCHGGSHVDRAGHYYCKGPGVREGAMRSYDVPVRVDA